MSVVTVLCCVLCKEPVALVKRPMSASPHQSLFCLSFWSSTASNKLTTEANGILRTLFRATVISVTSWPNDIELSMKQKQLVP